MQQQSISMAYGNGTTCIMRRYCLGWTHGAAQKESKKRRDPWPYSHEVLCGSSSNVFSAVCWICAAKAMCHEMADVCKPLHVHLMQCANLIVHSVVSCIQAKSYNNAQLAVLSRLKKVAIYGVLSTAMCKSLDGDSDMLH